MGKLTCEICGCDTLLKEGEYFRCAGCGACYSSEQLRAMQKTPEIKEETEEERKTLETYQSGNAELNKQNAKSQMQDGMRKFLKKLLVILLYLLPDKQNAKSQMQDGMRKFLKKLPVILLYLLPVAVVVIIVISGLKSSGVLPQKQLAKTNIEDHLKYIIEDENITLESVHFDAVHAKKFRTREEDTVGYFAYMEKPMKKQNADGTVTEYNRFDELRESLDLNCDPAAGVKWAYIATGTYKAKHKEYGDIPGEFYIVYVHNTFANYWYYVKDEHGASLDMLRKNVKNYLTAYLSLAYDIQPSPKIEITSIEKEQGDFTNYTVYGKVVVKDKYGEEYSGKFTATYQYTNYDHQFRELSTEVDELTRNRWADILK